MSKSKQGPALFELLRGGNRETAESTKIPSWMEKRDGGPDREVMDRSEQAPPIPRVVPAVRENSEPDSLPPLLEFDGPALRISLTSKSGAVALLGFVVILAVAFSVGRNSRPTLASTLQIPDSPPAKVSEIAELQRKPANTQLVEGISITNPAPASFASAAPVKENPAQPPKSANPVPQTTWVKGNTYIVAQGFPAGQTDDARRAQAFLEDHGIPTAIVVLSGGVIHLTTKEGYNRKDNSQAAKADDLLRRVQAVGEKYFAAGGRYRLEGYFKTMKDDTW